MLMPKMWSLSAVLVSTLAVLCQARVIVVEPFHDTPSPTEATLRPRASLVTEGGTITGSSSDLLYTYGLATCVGMTATGNENPNSGQNFPVNKVLGHISCERNQADIDDWVNTVMGSSMTELEITVSVVDPNLVDEELRDAQTALNNYAFSQAQSLVPDEPNRIVKVTRGDSLDAPEPKGTVKILENRQTEAEGQIVWSARS